MLFSHVNAQSLFCTDLMLLRIDLMLLHNDVLHRLDVTARSCSRCTELLLQIVKVVAAVSFYCTELILHGLVVTA